VADGVNVGVGDDCFVGVAVSVAVEVEEAVTVTGIVAVKVEISVEVMMGEGDDVISGGVTGFRVDTTENIIRRIIPMKPGMMYFLKAGGRMELALSKGVTTGGFPVYPSADKRFLKVSAYSPLKKLT
jgi:hypothetical protein